MAEKAEKKPEAAPSAAADRKEPAKGAVPAGGAMGGMLGKTPVLLGVAMVVEAAVLFAGFKFLGAGAKPTEAGLAMPAHGEEGGHGEGGESAPVDRKKKVEVPVLDVKAPNRRMGRTFIYDVSIVVQTRAEHEKTVKDAIKDHEALIKDRFRTIIAQSDPEKLGGGSEPGLETLRRQVKYQLDEIVGEGLIDEVLVPRCIPIRAD